MARKPSPVVQLRHMELAELKSYLNICFNEAYSYISIDECQPEPETVRAYHSASLALDVVESGIPLTVADIQRFLRLIGQTSQFSVIEAAAASVPHDARTWRQDQARARATALDDYCAFDDRMRFRCREARCRETAGHVRELKPAVNAPVCA